MNIVVLLCDGIFGQKPVYIDGGAKIYEKNLYFVCNPSDLHAIALAMSIKKMIGDTLVTAISIGNARAADLVRKAMLIGADRGIWGDCTAVPLENSYDIGFALANIIERYCRPFDMVLMGNSSQDYEFGIVGSTLARTFGIHIFDNVSDIETIDPRKYMDHGTVTFHKIMEKGDRLVCESSSPLILGVSGSGKGLNDVRLDELLRNTENGIEVVDVEGVLDASGVHGSRMHAAIEFLGYLEPRPRPKKIPVPDSSLNAMDRLKNITAGSLPGKATNIVEGEPDRVAAEFVKCISTAGS